LTVTFEKNKNVGFNGGWQGLWIFPRRQGKLVDGLVVVGCFMPGGGLLGSC
jgi:hypothetical protein